MDRLSTLNSYVSLVERKVSARSADPSVIILFGWLDAQQKHLLKYVDGLQNIFPSSAVVVIKATSSYYFSSQRTLESVLAPAASILQTHAANRSNFSGVLIHVLSNGGGFQFMTLRKILANMNVGSEPSVRVQVPTALVMDSTPGHSGLASSVASWAPKNPVLRLLSIPPISMIYGIFYAINSLTGNPPIFDELRSSLNTVNLLPTVTDCQEPSASPRLYIFSDKDHVVPAYSVVNHMNEAKARGLHVDHERYERSSHVSHLRVDPERYWAAVSRLWSKAMELHALPTAVL
ncbi:hypothetical protein PUNSTDRAFT_134400 [Punctularia strigosozonata HHB-11173 SS5]|uniref:uncharacterized protein n=1 Tax=Punctularia strigosozonata (strain HHB-11173) TaxID=741275 RepID=UPI0004417210|nr:uncharacterized protein PUNSTDRAFT_134400 [Punctularia strigosozonata HHB-11173 SS5]EIN09237.1 hypothetical protein PUNSTDRAFT_134400 [Punctularia strigosozonata HHB-11173 SS5]